MQAYGSKEPEAWWDYATAYFKLEFSDNFNEAVEAVLTKKQKDA